jgi:hypothetical protein
MINAEVAEEREGKSLNELSYLVIRRAMKVHTELGPGLYFHTTHLREGITRIVNRL